MNTFKSLEALYFILAIASIWIGVMLTWLLFEAALFAHRANRTLKDGLDKLHRFEQMVSDIKERLQSSAGYLSILAKGGEALMGFMEKKAKKSRRGRGDDDEE
ncbi:MAG: hypothetical protein RL141_1003 [Candidatus Parcubacteria bacterium]|jgi:hypothetical protein